VKFFVRDGDTITDVFSCFHSIAAI
jgi:hypothetical protein